MTLGYDPAPCCGCLGYTMFTIQFLQHIRDMTSAPSRLQSKIRYATVSSKYDFCCGIKAGMNFQLPYQL